MNGFTSFITSFCGGCIIIGLLYMLSPEKYKQILKLTFGIIFILSVISSFANIKKISIPKSDSVQFDAVQNEISVTSARLVYEQTLKNSQINFKEIEVCTDKSEDGSIVITKVIIYSDEDENKILSALCGVAENYKTEIIRGATKENE